MDPSTWQEKQQQPNEFPLNTSYGGAGGGKERGKESIQPTRIDQWGAIVAE